MNITSIVPKVRCPRCGSKTLDNVGFYLFHLEIKGHKDYRYRCKNCNLYFWLSKMNIMFQKRLEDFGLKLVKPEITNKREIKRCM